MEPSSSEPMRPAPQPAPAADDDAHITVRGLTMAYGDLVVMRDLNFTITRGEVFVIMGPSGCGKSTLLRHMIGLNEPAAGDVRYGDFNFTAAGTVERRTMLRRFGVLYQGGALWSSMTLAENIGLALEEFTDLTPAQIREIAALKLSLVGLNGFEDYYPSQVSGGMQKRAGLARAIALDPEVLFFDEPSAGLESDKFPSARRTDPRVARQPGSDCGAGHARAAEHFRDWRRQHLSRSREPHHQRPRKSQRAARELARSAGAPVSEPGPGWEKITRSARRAERSPREN